jgi:putative ABC transport system permease protein
VETIWQDVRYGLRMLTKNPGFTVIAVLTLALGIGANTAIFSVVNSVLLRPLPYPDSERLATVFEKRVREGMYDNVASPADYLDSRQRNTVFERMAAHQVQWADLIDQGEPERLGTVQATADFFDVLGIRPAAGRLFQIGDDQADRDKIVVLSYGLWQRRFGGDAQIIGRSLNLAGVQYMVVGVLPENFRFAVPGTDLWIPWTFPANFVNVRGAHFVNVYARMKPGVTLQQAQAEMDGIATQLEQENPNVNRGHGVNLVPLREQLVGDVRKPLLALFGAVSFVLLIACLNVANLLLARGVARRREFAVRSALGAGRGRLIRQLLMESLLLAGAAGGTGLLLAVWGIEALKAILPQGLMVIGLDEFGLEMPVLFFLLGISVVTILLFGLMPAMKVAGVDLNETLKESGRAVTGALAHRRLRGGLVVVEVALSLVLLAGAGLMIRTFVSLYNVKPGFDAQNVLTFQLGLVANRYPDPLKRADFYRQLTEEIRALPGVTAAGAISHLPMSGQDSRTGVGIEGRESNPDEPKRMHHRVVTPEYFQTMRIPLLEGRALSERDTRDAPPVLLVNAAAARRFWPGGSPTGSRVQLGGTEVWREVVGVVGDVKHWGLDANVNPEMYLPIAQTPTGFMNVVVRARGEPAALMETVRGVVRRFDKQLPAGRMRTMDDVMATWLSPRRFVFVLLGVFAGVALVLAGVGLYGLMNQLVAQRAHEIGIRMALGAQKRDVMELVVSNGMRLALLGLAVGLAGGLALTQFLGKLLYGVQPTDPITFVAVAMLLGAVALLACWIPARRATRVDPMVALRYE